MSKTPTKLDLTYQFKARDITTLNKDDQEIKKTVYSHILKLHGLFCDWLKKKKKGSREFKAVTALKLQECLEDYYPSELKSYMQTLLEILDNLKNILDSFQMISGQLRALTKLQQNNEPAISTWSVSQISKNVIEIVESLEMEYKLKEVIIENVAHCRDEQLIEVYITAWEQEVYLNIESFAYLFAEFGLDGLP